METVLMDYLKVLRGALSSVSVVSFTLFVGISTYLIYLIVTEAFSPLRKYPGPYLAKWTNWWRFALVRSGEYHFEIKKLHDKYGPILRIGPNLLDLDFPELAKTIYGTDGKWRKTEFYHNNSTIINGKITYHLFSETNQVNHALMKRPIVKYYSQGSVLALEPLMDAVIRDFCQHLETRFINNETRVDCDLGEWIAFYSWDMNGAASFSQRFGYMDKGFDYDHTISIADKALDYFAAVGQMPVLDFLLDKNPIMRIGPPNLGNVTRIASEHMTARLQGKDKNFDPKVPDFLQFFIDAKAAHPEAVDEGVIMGYLLVNLLAGADTTAITIRAIFYYLLKTPTAYRNLEDEIMGAGFKGVAPFHESRALPYLEAVVREAMRLHPGVCFLLERYVPEGGFQLPGGAGFVPAGTAVGINAYISGRNPAVWGGDPDVFRPERWLRGHSPGLEGETEPAYRERMRLFAASDLAFGGGSRICIGRSLALMEVYKIVATLVSRYEIELTHPEKEWKVTGSWFARQKGLICRIRARKA
ncbi:cytochrome P450 [Xylariales sp. PMI_506]|nr:cytochrome P450 [Xylariales sp. PMI_506]